jgi:hypothetical protein
MKIASKVPLDVVFEGSKIEFQGFDREAKEAIKMYTIETAQYLFWFEVLKCQFSNNVAVRVTDFGWPDRYNLRGRIMFTRASANSAREAIVSFFTAPNQKVLDVSIPKEQWITEVIFSPDWVLVDDPHGCLTGTVY